MTGNLSISATAGSNPMLSLTDADVAHGMTDLSTSTDTVVQIRPTSSTGGGAWVRGLSDTGTISGAYIQGIIGAEDPTDAIPAIVIDGSKKSGTGYQAMGAAETALKVQTGLSADLVTVLGNGDTTIAGSVTAPIVISSTPTGTAPLTVTSTTMVDNLNADMLDGFDASQIQGFNLPIDEYYLHNTKLIDDGTSVWVDKRWDNDAVCTYSVDTTNYLLNAKSVRGTGAAGGSGIHLVKALNLNLFNDGSTSGTTDYIYVVLYCADSTKLGDGTNAYTLILANDAFGTTTNCLYYSITKASIATGWNFLSIAKSAFGVAGTGTFASISGVSLDFAVAPTESTYFSIQVIQLIRKDPLGSRPWLFQINVNGTMTNDFTYDSGQMFIGYEYSKLICKNLSSAASATIISAATYTDFIGDIVFRTKSATVSYIQWLYDGNNYLQVGLYGGNVECILKQAGVTTTTTKAFTVVSGDVIDLRFSKKGTVIEIIVRKNYDDATLLSLNMTTTITTAGYIRPVLNDTTYLESFNFTTTEHAYHASVSELAKNVENKWRDWTPVVTWTAATPVEGSVVQTARYTTIGNTCFINYSFTATDGNGATGLTISLPVTPKDNNGFIALTAIQRQNTTYYNPMAYIDDDSGGIAFCNFTTCTDAQAVYFFITGQYEI
jgi:hypothetical protein